MFTTHWTPGAARISPRLRDLTMLWQNAQALRKAMGFVRIGRISMGFTNRKWDLPIVNGCVFFGFTNSKWDFANTISQEWILVNGIKQQWMSFCVWMWVVHRSTVGLFIVKMMKPQSSSNWWGFHQESKDGYMGISAGNQVLPPKTEGLRFRFFDFPFSQFLKKKRLKSPRALGHWAIGLMETWWTGEASNEFSIGNASTYGSRPCLTWRMRISHVDSGRLYPRNQKTGICKQRMEITPRTSPGLRMLKTSKAMSTFKTAAIRSSLLHKTSNVPTGTSEQIGPISNQARWPPQQVSS